jgi:hypothetical protein
MPQRALSERWLWPSEHLRGGLVLHLEKTIKLESIFVPYIMPLLWKVQRYTVIRDGSGSEHLLSKKLQPKNKAGGALPQAPP